jgi:hypothetical protein
MISCKELLSLYQEIKLNESKAKEDYQNENRNKKSKSSLHFHLLNKWDIKTILKFMRAFLKKGRSLFEETDREYLQRKNTQEILDRKAHIEALNKLETARKSGDKQNQWKYINIISTHFIPKINSFTRIPNITGFKIKLSRFHPILKLFGILLRMEKADLKFCLLDKEDRLNKYQNYMWKKLHDSRSNPKAFWFYGTLLLGRSTVFLLSNIRKIHPTWYKSHTLKYVQELIKEYRNLNLNKFNFRRLNIPKADGTQRPIGIPTDA